MSRQGRIESGKKACPKVAIVIINWNGWPDTLECLESLRFIEYSNHVIILIDNNSQDDSVARIREWCQGKLKVERPPIIPPSPKEGRTIRCVQGNPTGGQDKSFNPQLIGEKEDPSAIDLILWRCAENLGFSGANNFGLRWALKEGCDYIWLLNNDTVVAHDSLRNMVDMAERNSLIGIVGSKLLRYYSPSEVQSLGMRSFFWPIFKQNNITTTKASLIKLKWVWAASMLVRNSMIRDIGFLNEDYFFTAEDLDWCYRARKKRWLIRCSIDSRVWHKGEDKNASADKEFGYFEMRCYYEIRNQIVIAIRYRPLQAICLVTLNIYRMLKSLLFCNYKSKRIKLILRAQYDGLFLNLGRNS